MNRLMMHRVGGLAGVTALVGAAVVVSTSGSTANAEDGSPPEVAERRVLTDEHVDAINVGVDGQQLTMNSKVSPPAEYVDVDELVFQLSDLGHVEGLPARYAEFIGADDAWVIPQAQSPDVIWAGWSTEDIASGEVDGDAVDITLADVRGPGQVEVWQTVGFGEVRRIFSSDEDHKVLNQGVNAHVHANWAFTEPGVYTLTFVASATVGGQPVESDPVEYTWVVGGGAGVLPEPAASTTVLQAPSSAEPGEEVSLTAGVGTDTAGHAPPEPGGYVEFRDGDESLGWTGIADGEATLPVSFDEPGEHVITATYVPQEPQFYAGSDADPVAIAVDDPAGGDDGTESGTDDGTDDGTENGDENGDGDPPGQCEDPRTTLTDEHTDLVTPVLDGTDLDLRAKVGSANDHTFYAAEDVSVQVKDPEAVISAPGGDGYGFLGEAGDDLWVIPQAQNPEVVWAGWSTEELAPGDFQDDAVDMTLVDVDGPGFVEVFQTGGLGSAPERIFSSQDELEPREQSVGQHVHANWAFSQLGEYTLTFEVTGILADGTDVSSGEVDYAFVVGDPECAPGNGGDEAGGDGGTDAVGGDAGDKAGDEAGGDDSGGDVSGGDDGTDAGGGETGGDESGGDESGGDETGGDETGGDETGGDESGGDESGGDESGGDESGGDASGGDDGADGGTDNGAGPKPTTKPTNGVCPDGMVPAGSQPSATPSSDGSAQDGDESGDDNGNDGGNGTDDGSGDDAGPSGEQVVLTNEHVDLLSPQLSGSDLTLQVKVGSANDHTFHDPDEVLVQVKPEAESTVPDGAGYGFLGDAGDAIWLIPETQDPQIVWAGWSTEELSSGDFQGDAVDMRMVDVQGPGTLEVFQTTGFGDVSRIFSSTDSLDPRRQSIGQHVHANWAFSAEGEYTVTFEVSGTLAGGESATTGSVEYTFTVGELSGTNNQASSSGASSAVISPALYTGSGSETAAAATQTLPDTGAGPVSVMAMSASAEVVAASDEEDCVLASTGTSGVGNTAVFGGLLVLLGGVAALYAYRRRGIALT